MPDTGGVRIAVVGLHFGAQFVPIYQRHPDVAAVAVCDTDEALMQRVADGFGIADRYSSLNGLLSSGEWDAVHLLTPVPLHVEQTLAVLSAGRHCACAVPMATSIEDLHRIVSAQRHAGRNYMMMETAVYTREFLYAKDLNDRGEFGPLTFLRGTYFQDLEGGYPLYWRAQPPMHYATHAVAPLLALAGARASRVCCFGAGTLREDLQQPGGNRFPLETAIFQLAGSDAAAEVTRSWFQTARPYTEAFSVYGERAGFEWQQLEHEEPLLYTLEPLKGEARGRHTSAVRVTPPDRTDLLPEAIAPFTQGGHGGSHPHLAHEFIRSIVEERSPAISAVTAADWTAPGICAHDSAMLGGMPIEIPSFGRDGSA